MHRCRTERISVRECAVQRFRRPCAVSFAGCGAEAVDPQMAVTWTPAGFLLEGVLETFAQFMSMNLGTETLKGMKFTFENQLRYHLCVE